MMILLTDNTYYNLKIGYSLFLASFHPIEMLVNKITVTQ